MKYTAELLQLLYQTMVRIRISEESLVAPILKGTILTPCHLYSGQEAIAAGIGVSLERGTIFSEIIGLTDTSWPKDVIFRR